MKRATTLLTSTLLLAAMGVNAQVQNGINLDGNDDHIQTTYTGISGSAARTVEAWIRTFAVADPNNGGTQQVITDWGNGTPNGARFTFNVLWANAIRLEVAGNGLSGSIAVNDGNWHHVAVVYDPAAVNEVSLYVDGVLDVAGNLTVGVNTATTVPLRIGERVDAAKHFAGDIDEVRVWDVARTQADIQNDMNGEYCTIPANLKAYYTFNEGVAGGNNAGLNMVADLSGNGNDGTLQNMALNGASSNWVGGAPISVGIQDTLISAVACDSYTFAGNTYTSTGVYATTLTSVGGCDSVVSLDLTINNSDAVTDTQTACDMYTWNGDGNTYTTSGMYTANLMNINGCDSAVTLDLTVNYSNSGSETVTQCGGLFTWPATGLSYQGSGTFSATITNMYGCDSVATLYLTIDEVDTSVTDNGNGTFTSADAMASHQWLDCDNLYAPVNGANAQTLMPAANGSYAVEVTMGTCVDTSQCLTITNVGMEELTAGVIGVHPNPTTGELHITLTEFNEAHVSLLDINGREIASSRMQKGVSTLFQIQDQTPGIYALRVLIGSSVYHERIILQ